MAKKLALIHTGSFLVPMFEQLVKQAMPDVTLYNIVDDSLIKQTIAANELTPLTSRRLAGYIASAEQAGVDAIVVTCSSVGPAVDAYMPFVGVPLLRIDQAMADAAVGIGKRIGVVATLPTTLKPTVDLVRTRAAVQNRDVDIVEKLCEGAFEAVSNGDGETHDRIVREGLLSLMLDVDVIVLAQASMARVVDSLPDEERKVPILSSPKLGIEAARQVLEGKIAG